MRKKLLVSLLLCAVLCLALGAAAYAESSYVGDAAQLLTDEQRASLEERCESAALEYGCGIYIVTVENYLGYGNSVESAAETIYNYSSLGLGEGRNGIMLLLSMDDRDYDLAAHGDFANAAFTDYGKELLADSFLDDFAEDGWYQGFSDYVSEAVRYMGYAREGSPVDVYGAQAQGGYGIIIAIIILVPCLIAFAVCMIFRAQMKTAKIQTGAADYIASKGVHMRIAQDLFTHRTQSVQVIPRNRGGGGGRGGTSVNSGGFSHHSGKF